MNPITCSLRGSPKNNTDNKFNCCRIFFVLLCWMSYFPITTILSSTYEHYSTIKFWPNMIICQIEGCSKVNIRGISGKDKSHAKPEDVYLKISALKHWPKMFRGHNLTLPVQLVPGVGWHSPQVLLRTHQHKQATGNNERLRNFSKENMSNASGQCRHFSLQTEMENWSKLADIAPLAPRKARTENLILWLMFCLPYSQ